MKSCSTQYSKKQSGESNLDPRSCKDKSTAKKRGREDTDSKDARQDEEDYQQCFQENFRLKAQINSLMSEVSSLKQLMMKSKVDLLLCKNDNRPMMALWEALNHKAAPGIELPMAIVMDPRCGIERRVERDDNNLIDSGMRHLDKSSPLVMAVRTHRNDVVEALLLAGADPSARDVGFGTAFLVAASNGNVTAMDLLFRSGADPFSVDVFGNSALHLAAYEGLAVAVQWLLELGAGTEAVDGHGQTPLQTNYRGHVPSIKALLDNGANLEAAAKNGWTPLHCASVYGHIGAIETLVWQGASITAKDKKGRSPFGLCKDRSLFHCTDAEKARGTALLTPTSTKISSQY